MAESNLLKYDCSLNEIVPWGKEFLLKTFCSSNSLIWYISSFLNSSVYLWTFLTGSVCFQQNNSEHEVEHGRTPTESLGKQVQNVKPEAMKDGD